MRSMKRQVAGLFLIVLAIGCAQSVTTERKIVGVQRILMHETGDWTLLVELSSRPKELVEQRIWAKHRATGSSTYVRDVPPNEAMWVSYRDEISGCDGESYKDNFVFHIHSADDINGGGWNHGKAGQGQTNVVQ